MRARRVVLAMVLLAILWLTINYISPRHIADHFSYLTRPLWEKPDKPFNMINHYYATNTSYSTLCGLHGWKHSQKQHKIYDAILFSVELDLLEIRLRELYQVVDKFIILESNSTFTGMRKDLVFEMNRERFDFARDKIIYEAVHLPGLRPNQDPFELEAQHRISMNKLLQKAGVVDGDWVTMMDVDEIPSANTLKLFQNCDGIPSIIHLQLRNYIYSFEFLLDYNSWRGKVVQYNYRTFYSHSRQSDMMLADAGWHCSFCFPKIQDFQFKMKAYSHADRVHFDYILKPERIQKVICDGSDIFDMLPEAHTYQDMFQKWGKLPKQTSQIDLPQYLVQHGKERFPYLLPGGCIRKE